VHQRDATRSLIAAGVVRSDDFTWLAQARFYFTPLHRQIEAEKQGGSSFDDVAEPPVLRCLRIRIARASFYYGFEYLGVVRPLLDFFSKHV
jgi:dynein heavy chain 1